MPLLDMMLPGMNGLELARRLKADPYTSDIPIVAMTTYPERFSKAEALAAGCDAYLTKPIRAAELTSRIEDTVHAHDSPAPREAS